MSFTKKVLFSMVTGIVVGLLINNFFIPNQLIESILINQVFHTISSIFLILLKMIVLPLIFVSIISGIISINDVNTLGRLGINTITLYIFTTMIAITLALFISSFVNYNIEVIDVVSNTKQALAAEPSSNFILSIFPQNFFAALVDGNVIQVLSFAIFIGISASYIKNEIPEFINLIDNLNKIFNKMVLIIISFTPIAVFALLAKTFSIEGIRCIYSLNEVFFHSCTCFIIAFHFYVFFAT